MRAIAFWTTRYRHNCSGGYINESTRGQGTRIDYYAPKSPSDLKRFGKMITITVGNASMCLNGKDLKSLKSLLRKVGEIA